MGILFGCTLAVLSQASAETRPIEERIYSNNRPVRFQALVELSKENAMTKLRVLPFLLDRLNSNASQESLTALAVLSQDEDCQRQLIPRAMELLRSSDADQRARGRFLLLSMAPAANSALERGLMDNDPAYRREIISAINEMEDPSPLIRALIDTMKDSDPLVRAMAVGTLGGIPGEGQNEARAWMEKYPDTYRVDIPYPRAIEPEKIPDVYTGRIATRPADRLFNHEPARAHPAAVADNMARAGSVFDASQQDAADFVPGMQRIRFLIYTGIAVVLIWLGSLIVRPRRKK